MLDITLGWRWRNGGDHPRGPLPRNQEARSLPNDAPNHTPYSQMTASTCLRDSKICPSLTARLYGVFISCLWSHAEVARLFTPNNQETGLLLIVLSFPVCRVPYLQNDIAVKHQTGHDGNINSVGWVRRSQG